MFGIHDLPSFALAVLVFLMIPGPGTFAVLTSTAKGRVPGGYAAVFGIILGDWLLMSAAMLGVAALLLTHPALFRTVQYLGVAYLVWVGIQLLRATGKAPSTILPVTPGRYFRMSFLITLVNPKAIVFYMAFFPLFIDPATYEGPRTLVAMAFVISLITLAWCSVLVFGGHWAARHLRERPAVQRWLSRFAGVALIGFGVRLATD
jgi:threonine/homoserine/homoserine lactone efflux protein